MLCIWPNCLEMTEPNKISCLYTQMLLAQGFQIPNTAQTAQN